MPGGSWRATISPGRAQRAASVLGGVGRTTMVPGGLQRAAFMLGRIKRTTDSTWPSRRAASGLGGSGRTAILPGRAWRATFSPGGFGRSAFVPASVKISGCGVYFSRIENLENCNGKMPDRQSIEENTKIPMYGLTDEPTDRPHVDFPSHSRIKDGQTPTCLGSGALISSHRQGLPIIPARIQCSPNTPAVRFSLPLLEEVLSVWQLISSRCYSEAQILLLSTTVKHKFCSFDYSEAQGTTTQQQLNHNDSNPNKTLHRDYLETLSGNSTFRPTLQVVFTVLPLALC